MRLFYHDITLATHVACGLQGGVYIKLTKLVSPIIWRPSLVYNYLLHYVEPLFLFLT